MTGFVVEHDSALTAWGQVHRDLRHRIDTGLFAVGTRIPSEQDLMSYYDVSRPTVRRATRELEADGYLSIRQGSGTFVRQRSDVRCDLDLGRPWRQQIVSTGHDAESRLLESHAGRTVPTEIAQLFAGAATALHAMYGRHVQLVDGIPIAETESWYFAHQPRVGVGPSETLVDEAGVIEIGMTTAAQATTLESFLDIPLIVVMTVSRIASTARIVEVSRTSWLASRVRLLHHRTVALSALDMTDLVRSDPGREPGGR